MISDVLDTIPNKPRPVHMHPGMPLLRGAQVGLLPSFPHKPERNYHLRQSHNGYQDLGCMTYRHR